MRLSEAARISFTIEQVVAGRRIGRSCRPQTRADHKRRRCVRFVKPRRFSIKAIAGQNARSCPAGSDVPCWRRGTTVRRWSQLTRLGGDRRRGASASGRGRVSGPVTAASWQFWPTFTSGETWRYAKISRPAACVSSDRTTSWCLGVILAQTPRAAGLLCWTNVANSRP